jgi:hypothetical protein
MSGEPEEKHPILFRGDENDPDTLSGVIGEGCGAVSACWENLSGAGEFQSTRASWIVDEIVDWIQTNYIPRTEASIWTPLESTLDRDKRQGHSDET